MGNAISVGMLPAMEKRGVIFNKKVHVGEFMQIEDAVRFHEEVVDPARPNNKIRVGDGFAINIKDETKIEMASVLLNRWMHYPIGKDSVYVRHVASDRVNVMYQIVLSGQAWDGVYEMSLKNRQVQLMGYCIDGRNTLSVKSGGNYDVAMFRSNDKEEHSVTRIDYPSDEAFRQALLETGLVEEDDLDIYYKPDARVQPYLDKILPRIILQ